MQKQQEQIGTQVVRSLARAMRNTSFYALDHPTVQANINEAVQAIKARLEGRRELVLKFAEGEVIVDDQPLFDLATGTANLVGAGLRRGIESITFLSGVEGGEVAYLISLLAADPAEIAQRGGVSGSSARAKAPHILLEKLQRQSGGGEVAGEQIAQRLYVSAVDVLRATTRRTRLNMTVELGTVHRVIEELIDNIITEESALLGLISVKGRDEYTFTHALHICILCLELGYSLQLDNSQLRELGVSALLHDIGKIFVPLSLLRKPSSLTPEEFAVIRQHPIHGALLLCPMENCPPTAPLVALQHHQYQDQTGYPASKKAFSPILYSLMVGLADVYDALTTDRPYRPPLAPQAALEEIHAQASHFEPRLLSRFTQMLGKYPAGSLVQLSDGALAVVVRPNPRQTERPFVRRLEWEDAIPGLAPEEIDLAKPDASGKGFVISIERSLDAKKQGIDVCSLLGGNPFCTE
jgi:HD-GYP domain-containing protein (c-di-GMP phosphodiesterase class II)